MDAITGRPDFAAQVAQAQRELHEGIVRSGLQRDAYRYPIMAYSVALGVLPAFIEEINQARQPWTHDERKTAVQEAVKQLRQEAGAFVAEATSRRVLLMAGAGIALLLIGVGGGYWFGSRTEAQQYAKLPIEINRALDKLQAAAIQNRPTDAILWLGLMQNNDIRSSIGGCTDARSVDGRSACNLPFWLGPAAPPKGK